MPSKFENPGSYARKTTLLVLAYRQAFLGGALEPIISSRSNYPGRIPTPTPFKVATSFDCTYIRALLSPTTLSTRALLLPTTFPTRALFLQALPFLLPNPTQQLGEQYAAIEGRCDAGPGPNHAR